MTTLYWFQELLYIDGSEPWHKANIHQRGLEYTEATRALWWALRDKFNTLLWTPRTTFKVLWAQEAYESF